MMLVIVLAERIIGTWLLQGLIHVNLRNHRNVFVNFPFYFKCDDIIAFILLHFQHLQSTSFSFSSPVSLCMLYVIIIIKWFPSIRHSQTNPLLIITVVRQCEYFTITLQFLSSLINSLTFSNKQSIL